MSERLFGTRVTSMKVEPIPQAINPAGVSQLGSMVGSNPAPLVDGRGFSAPRPTAETTSNSGSQGRH